MQDPPNGIYLTMFKDLSGHFVVGVGVEKMSSLLGSSLFPSVSLSLSDLRGGDCRPLLLLLFLATSQDRRSHFELLKLLTLLWT